jgi:hypothetical protein
MVLEAKGNKVKKEKLPTKPNTGTEIDSKDYYKEKRLTSADLNKPPAHIIQDKYQSYVNSLYDT